MAGRHGNRGNSRRESLQKKKTCNSATGPTAEKGSCGLKLPFTAVLTPAGTHHQERVGQTWVYLPSNLSRPVRIKNLRKREKCTASLVGHLMDTQLILQKQLRRQIRKVRLAFDLEKFSEKVSHVNISLFPARLPGGLEITFMPA